MANEFVVQNGLLSLDTSTVSGSLTVTGGITGSFTGSLVGRLTGTSSWASNAISSSFATTASAASSLTFTPTTASFAITSSYVLPSGLPLGTVSGAAQTIAHILGQSIFPSRVTASNGISVYGPLQIYSSSGVTSYDANSAYWYTSGSGIDLWYRHKANSQVKMDWFEGILETGLVYGGIRGFSGSEAYINAGEGIIVNHGATTSSITSPTVTYVSWPILTASIDVTSGFVTYLAISNTGTIISQSTKFTPAQYHDALPLGAVGHFNQQAIVAKGDQVNTQHSPLAQLADFTRNFGPIKVGGYGITAQSGSLKFSRAAGDAFIYGGFYTVNPETPSNYQSSAVNTGSLAYVYRTGSAQGYAIDANNNNFYTDVKPGFYDVGGTAGTASLASNEWSIQRVFIEPVSGIHYVYYGQSKYTSLANAVANILTDPFAEGPATTLFTVFLGYLIMKGDTTNLADTGSNSILSAGLFRNTSAGSVGGGATAQLLNDLSDVTITSPTNGQALVYSSGNWINGNPTSASFATSGSFTISSSFATSASFAPAGPGTSQSIALFNSTNTLSSSVILQSGNNIGIGTSSPASILDISQATNDALLRVRSTGAGSYIMASSNDSNYFGFILASGSSITTTNDRWFIGSYGSPGDLTFTTGRTGTEYMRIVRSTGRVGIGTTSPSALLHVSASGTTDDVLIGSTAAPKFFISASGNIGINTLTPAERLRVNGTFASDALWTAVSGVTNWGSYPTVYGTLTWDTAYARVHASTGRRLDLGANGTNAHITITGSGDVGIGITSSFSNKLHVQGNVSASSYTSSISNAVGFVGTSSWAQSSSVSVSSSFATTASFTNTVGILGNVTASSIVVTSSFGQLFTSSSASVSSGVSRSFTDTGLFANQIGNHAIYEMHLAWDPNVQGSPDYRHVVIGDIIVMTNWNGTAVTSFIGYNERYALSSGSIGVQTGSVDVLWVSSSGEERRDCPVRSSANQIRIKYDGFTLNSPVQNLRLTRKL